MLQLRPLDPPVASNGHAATNGHAVTNGHANGHGVPGDVAGDFRFFFGGL